MLKSHARSTRFPKIPTPSLPVATNEKILVWVGDELLPRDNAMVSVFDSVVQGGDSVWEGLRIYNGKVFKLEEHLNRMFDSEKALALNNAPTRDEIKESIFKTLIRNGMFDNAHIRLSLTRVKKVTSGMIPGYNLYGCTIIGLMEGLMFTSLNSKPSLSHTLVSKISYFGMAISFGGNETQAKVNTESC
ncbi:unnamed protein product [Lactuca saligna]|uniref:Branched-chain-amino-acid aminotransferase n=1 Tax=Lactuca saligna TaxID=75948 RepID=A0AA35YQF9_LACSI|nr:unnamed protein product [Lactuca saligna]